MKTIYRLWSGTFSSNQLVLGYYTEKSDALEVGETLEKIGIISSRDDGPAFGITPILVREHADLKEDLARYGR